MVDITESKQAQEKLRFQAALLDSVRESVIATDLQGRVIYWGRGAEALYGYSEDEVIGRVVDFIVDPSQIQDERERMKVVLATGTWSGQYEQRRKDGSTFYADTLLSLVSDDRGQPIGFIGIDRDITEQRLYQDALRQSADTQRLMLQELDHRVRNNLAALAALIDIFRKSHTNVPAFAEAIRGRVQAMSVVHSLLSRARWEAVGLRRLVTTLVPADLHDRLTFEGDDAQIPPRQMTAMGMVLQELIANSLKYGCLRESTGSIRLTCNAVNRDGTTQLQLGWQESGGPRIESTPIGGQGSELIRGLVKTELRGEVELSYLESGACHQFTILLDSH